MRSETIVKSLTSFIVIVAIGYGVLVAVMYLAQRTFIYPGALGGQLAENIGWGESVGIDTPDGEKLAAIHNPAPSGGPTILFFLGNGDRIDRYGFLAAQLAQSGIGFLAVSYRGYPGSTGSPSEEGLLIDGLAAYDWLEQQSEGAIIGLGQSLGTGVVVHLATERAIQGLILVSAFDSVLDLARSVYFFLPVRPLLKDTYRSDLRIASVAQPKLFIHGDNDSIIPSRRGVALFDAAPEPKQMVILEGYGHNDIWAPPLVEAIETFTLSLISVSLGRSDHLGMRTCIVSQRF